MESSVVVVTWFRSRAARRAGPAKRHCIGCRTAIAGATDDELLASGGVLLEGAGWLCGARCERQYRLQFRIQPTPTPSAGNPRTTPTLVSRSVKPAEPGRSATAEEPSSPGRRSAQDELTAALRARRMKYSSGV